MRTTLALVFLFLLVLCVLLLVAMNCQPPIPGAQIFATALEWTLHLLGGIAASTALLGMLLVAAGHGSFQRQIVLALPLLGGLLLLAPNWGLALAFGALVGVWMFKFGAPEIERPHDPPAAKTSG